MEVYEQVGSQVRLLPQASQSESLEWYGELGPVRPPDDPDEFPDDAPPWVLDLVDWVESRRLERIRRSYWSWHYRGRQILRLRRTRGGGYAIVAGVAYSKPTGDQPTPVKLSASRNEGLSPRELELVREAVDGAIERRRTGKDRGQREHLLQAALGVNPALLGLVELRREYPAWRPAVAESKGNAYIDFVGLDVDQGLHVIETKIGPDPMLGIQGLDYWAWTTACRNTISADLGADSTADVELHFVMACSQKPLLHPAAAETIQLLHPDIPWRCHVIADWNTVARHGQLMRPHAIGGIRPRTVPDSSVCAEVVA